MHEDIYKTRHGFVIPDEHIPSDDDLSRYANGDTEIIPVLVEGLIGFIVNEIEWFLSCTERAVPYREDCISEGILYLQIFATKQLGREYSSTKFISHARTSCLNGVRDWLRESTIAITVPCRAQRHGWAGTKLRQTKLKEDAKTISNLFEEVYINEFLDKLDGFDRKLIELKMGDKSNRDIGNKLKMHYQTVQMHLDRLAKIFNGENDD